MSTPPVFWHEGMFLRPHHFQAADRFWADQLRISSRFDVQNNWGVRVADIDTDALRNYRFEVQRLAARFRDGTQLIAARVVRGSTKWVVSDPDVVWSSRESDHRGSGSAAHDRDGGA